MLSKLIRRIAVIVAIQIGLSTYCSGQIVVPTRGTQTATLEDQLINRLRATTEDRQAYIRLVVAKVNTGDFERGRVLALERYAIKKNSMFPFPYFERVMRAEAERVGVYLPPVQLLAGGTARTQR
jgi:hypothetical protein